MVGVVLKPRPHSGMKFASDDDDDIYEREHRLKGPTDLAWKQILEQ